MCNITFINSLVILDPSGYLYCEAVLSLWVYSEHHGVFGSYLLAYSCYTLLNTKNTHMHL